MFESLFGFSKRPFGKTPDPAFLYEGKAHAEALARLIHAAEEKDVAVLTGEIGAGKTTLSRALVDRLSDRFRVAMVVDPRQSSLQLLSFIAGRFGVDPIPRTKLHLIDALTARLYQSYESGLSPLLIVDEAQLLSAPGAWEDLRLLLNLQLDDENLFGLILLGQPELRDRLARPRYQSFAQRIGMAYHIGPLDLADTSAYIAHRCTIAGRTEALFQDDAVAAVFRGTGGIPRKINTVCQGALLVAAARSASRIEATIIEEVLDDLGRYLRFVFPREGDTGRRTRAAGRGRSVSEEAPVRGPR
jgi:type II secretory pathway predicted ATPase ExeA